jgi:2-polyprenyl-3-methyl-5-hydroxy-6-metoxy-1,4-benzoquinol methylase
MTPGLLEYLRCPKSGSRLVLADGDGGEHVRTGTLKTPDGRYEYPIVEYIPRFVPRENYASNFGKQWNEFRRTQLDSNTGLPLSRQRLLDSLGCPPEALNGVRLLDVGCGAGRFAEVALALGAEVTALDYSTAVDACWSNLGPHARLNVVQGDIYHLPFESETFDIVYCFGVLQHTPDVEGAFKALPKFVKKGGLLAADVYRKTPLNMMWPKYWMRPITKRMKQDQLRTLVELMVEYLLPVSKAISKIPVAGRKLRYAVPVSNHAPDWPLNEQQVKEWALLNTFDMLSPQYDSPQSAETLRSWFEQSGMVNIDVFPAGFYVGRAKKPTLSRN